MSIWLYFFKHSKQNIWDGWIVLFDGENTYWTPEMIPSVNYKLKGSSYASSIGQFNYIGEL